MCTIRNLIPVGSVHFRGIFCTLIQAGEQDKSRTCIPAVKIKLRIMF